MYAYFCAHFVEICRSEMRTSKSALILQRSRSVMKINQKVCTKQWVSARYGQGAFHNLVREQNEGPGVA